MKKISIVTALATMGLLGGGVAVASTVPPTDPVDTVSSAAQVEADAAVLVLEDFPQGWTATLEDKPTEQDLAYQAEVAACAGGTGSDLLDLGGATARTPDFEGPNGQVVEQTVTIVEPTVAEDFMARFGEPDVETCFGDAVRTFISENAENPQTPADSLPPGITIGDVTIERLDPTPVGDEVVGYRATVELSLAEQTVDSFVDIVAVRVGGSLSGLTFQSVFEPFPAEDVDHYLTIAVERLPG